MNMARYARAKVLLTGDIDRGGVYASFLGTWMTFTPWEKELLAGFVVNKFRGDPELLAPAHSYMLDRTGKPVLGVIPMIRNISIPEEDRAALPFEQDGQAKHADSLDVAVVMPAHVSNFTDFAPLAAEPDVRLRQVRTREEWGNPDLVILPGTKSVAADLAGLRAAGMEEPIRRHAEQGKWMLGVCGGLQMLGTDILDPLHMESAEEQTPGLGLLELSTTFTAAKTLLNVRRASTPLALPRRAMKSTTASPAMRERASPSCSGKTAPPAATAKAASGPRTCTAFWTATSSAARSSTWSEWIPGCLPIHPCTPPMTWTARWTAWRT